MEIKAQLDVDTLDRILKQAGVNRNELAVALDWPRQQLSHVLTSARQGEGVRLSTICLLAHAVGTTPEQLITEIAPAGRKPYQLFVSFKAKLAGQADQCLNQTPTKLKDFCHESGSPCRNEDEFVKSDQCLNRSPSLQQNSCRESSSSHSREDELLKKMLALVDEYRAAA